MTTQSKRYHATQRLNGTEDEIVIRSPNGKEMAVIQFWEYSNGERNYGPKQAAANARLIVKALNAYQGRR